MLKLLKEKSEKQKKNTERDGKIKKKNEKNAQAGWVLPFCYSFGLPLV